MFIYSNTKRKHILACIVFWALIGLEIRFTFPEAPAAAIPGLFLFGIPIGKRARRSLDLMPRRGGALIPSKLIDSGLASALIYISRAKLIKSLVETN
jgi:hypothetical protein